MNRTGKAKGDHCEPAATVIVKLGGVRALARDLSIDPSALSKWQTSSLRGGGGGLIPAKYHHTLMAIARARDVELRADDLIGEM